MGQPALEYGRPKFAVAGLDLDEESFSLNTKRIHNTELRPP
jgi:hypothetical protein